MNESKVQNEKKLLFELQYVSEKISDYISQGNFKSIVPLEKQRLKILENFYVKPSDNGVKILQSIIEKNKKHIDIIEKEKLKLNKNFKKVKNIFLAYGK